MKNSLGVGDWGVNKGDLCVVRGTGVPRYKEKTKLNKVTGISNLCQIWSVCCITSFLRGWLDVRLGLKI